MSLDSSIATFLAEQTRRSQRTISAAGAVHGQTDFTLTNLPPRFETHVLLNYATGDERDLSLLAFRNDMFRFVDTALRAEFNKLFKARGKVNDMLTELARLYYAWIFRDQMDDDAKPPPVDFGEQQQQQSYNEVMKSLTPARTKINVTYAKVEDMYCTPENPDTSNFKNTKRPHDGERVNFLRTFRDDLNQIETYVENAAKAWTSNTSEHWSSEFIHQNSLKPATPSYTDLGPDNAPDRVPSRMYRS
eukprot:m.473869 g.473869  ORF g.473869 m.473869 type:complete len:247 (-) comp35129_c0_seq1:101-841(-)